MVVDERVNVIIDSRTEKTDEHTSLQVGLMFFLLGRAPSKGSLCVSSLGSWRSGWSWPLLI